MKRILSTAGWLVVAAALTIGMTACSGSEDIADRVVLSKLDGKNNFLGGCSLIIQDNFYTMGGMQK